MPMISLDLNRIYLASDILKKEMKNKKGQIKERRRRSKEKDGRQG